MTRQVLLRFRSLFRRSRLEDDMSEELRFHLERQIEDNIKTGMTPREARYAALRTFGGVEQVKERCRDSRGVGFVEELGRDLRYGVRVLLRSRGFTLSALLALALGIAANTVIFSVIDGVLFRPLRFENPERLVRLFEENLTQGRRRADMSPRRFQTMLLALFSALALALAAIGIYGILHYSVTGRTHEIGIRIALGARPRDVLRMVVRQGLLLALIGFALGLIGVSWLTEAISSMLYGVTGADPLTFTGVALVLLVTALLASYIPARRAAKVDPLVALRHD